MTQWIDETDSKLESCNKNVCRLACFGNNPNMTSMVAKATGGSCSTQMPQLGNEKGSRNKRKFRADPPLSELTKGISDCCLGYEFSAEKFQVCQVHNHPISDLYNTINQDHHDELKLDLALASSEFEEFHDADWNDTTESQLEELVLNSLDTIFRIAINRIVSYGFTEEAATQGVLKSGLCYGCEDTVSNIVDNTLSYLRTGQDSDSSKDHSFDNMQQMEKYILAELVCVLREVRPFLSTGDAMWCLLLSDMNVSHACAMDGDTCHLEDTAEKPVGRKKGVSVVKSYKMYGSKGSRKAGVKNGRIRQKHDTSPELCPKRDECVMRLLTRIRQLQSSLTEWTEWTNQKVMQAARRLSKDKAELKMLKQENDEVERLTREKQTLEENTMKKLSEMENALLKASGQVEKANSTVRRLEIENAALRGELEEAKIRASKSAATCQEAANREKKIGVKLKSWEKQKAHLQEELATEKRKLHKLLHDHDAAKQHVENQEMRWRQEEKRREEAEVEAASYRREREELEKSTRAKEETIRTKAGANRRKYKEDIERLEREIAGLRVKTDSKKIALLRGGIDGGWAAYVSEMAAETGVRRERECVMCLTEEMSVVFLPCAHEVVCVTCNDLHERQGMKDCPSCRSPIQRRIPVRFSRS